MVLGTGTNQHFLETIIRRRENGVLQLLIPAEYSECGPSAEIKKLKREIKEELEKVKKFTL